MTLQQLNHPIFLPQMPKGFSSNVTDIFGSLGTLDSDDEKIAQIVLLPKLGNISKVHFRTGTVNSGEDVLVRLEDVTDADGDPSGNLWGTNTEATVAVAASDTWYTAELTADAEIASGDVGKPIAIVIVAPNGFTVGGGDLEIDFGINGFIGRTQYDTSFWAKTNLTGSWVDNGYTGTRVAAVRLEYDDGSFGFLQTSYTGDENPSSVTFDSGDTPDEIGIKLRIPVACRANGVWLNYLHREDSTIKVYDAGDVEKMANMPIRRKGWLARTVAYKGTYFAFGDTLEVIADAWYRITILPAVGTSNIAYYADQATAAHFGTWGLDQDDYKWTERTNGGGWTDRDARILFGGWIVDQIHDGAGGGAASVLGGGQLSGGFS